MRLLNLQKARFCRQHLEIHGNLGGQEPGAKKQFEYLLFEKMRLPTLKKLDFADNIVKFMEIWKVRSLGRHNNLKIFYLKKCACFKGLEAEAEVGMAVFFLDRCGPGSLLVFQFYLQTSGFWRLCRVKTWFQWQNFMSFSSLAPGGLNYNRCSNVSSKI